MCNDPESLADVLRRRLRALEKLCDDDALPPDRWGYVAGYAAALRWVLRRLRRPGAGAACREFPWPRSRRGTAPPDPPRVPPP